MKKKVSYPKQLTIRYDERQEKELRAICDHLNEKTMSKALLRSPMEILDKDLKIKKLVRVVDEQRNRIDELESIVNAWKGFNSKLENFFNNEEVKKEEGWQEKRQIIQA